MNELLKENAEKDNEISELKKELAEQKKLLRRIQAMLVVLLCVVGAYVLFKITVGSVLSQLIGFVAGLFG